MKASILVASAVMAMANSANSATIVLNFENIAPTYPFNSTNIFVRDYYNGGTSSAGTSGSNYGVQIGANGLLACLNTLAVACSGSGQPSNASRGGLGVGSDRAALFFLAGSETFMNVAAGFDTGFSFNYVSLFFSGAVRVYDGLNGTGNLLASLALTPNAGVCTVPNSPYCPFSPFGVAFAGVAKSVAFGGVANQIGFDDVTFGSITPGIPEPSTWLLLVVGVVVLSRATTLKTIAPSTVANA